MQIQASDGGVPPRRKEHTLRVNILDVNDNPPIIDSPFGYNVSVSEVSTQPCVSPSILPTALSPPALWSDLTLDDLRVGGPLQALPCDGIVVLG